MKLTKNVKWTLLVILVSGLITGGYILLNPKAPPLTTVNVYKFTFTADQQRRIFANQRIIQVSFVYSKDNTTNDINITAWGGYIDARGQLVYDQVSVPLTKIAKPVASSLSYTDSIFLSRGSVKALLGIDPKNTSPISPTDCTMDINFTPYATGCDGTDRLYYNASTGIAQRNANPHPPYPPPGSQPANCLPDCDNQ